MKNIIKMFCSLLVFFFLQYIVLVVMVLGLGIDLMTIARDNYLLTVLNFANDIAVGVVMLILSWKIIKKGLSSIKGNINVKNAFTFIWDLWVGIASLMIFKYAAAIVGAILSSLLGIQSEVVENQNLVETLLGSAPAMMIIATCVLAPIVEELVFRGALRDAIENKKVFITVSGLIFGFMHVTQNLFLLLGIVIIGLLVDYVMKHKDKFKGFCVTEKALYVGVIILYIVLLSSNNSTILLHVNKNEIIGSVVYVSLGWYLAHLYVKKDNIFYPILVHALNNILSVLLVLL